MVESGDIRLFEENKEVPQWRRRELLEGASATEKLDAITLELTPQGDKRIS
jgi:hypothetical protein